MATLIAASHGTDNSDGAAAISALVSSVQTALPDSKVFEAFVDVQSPDVPEVLRQAGGDEPAIVVPLLLATGFHVRQDIADAAFTAGSHTQISPALGPDARLVEVVIQRLSEVGYVADDLLVLAVAGSSDARAQEESVLVQLMLEQALGRKVELAFLSAAQPRLKELVPKLKFQNPRKRVVVATYLLAEGFFAGLTRNCGAHVVTNPLLVQGQSVPQQMIDVVVDRFESAAKDTNPQTTGCLSGLRNLPWLGCAAGCQSPCRTARESE